MALTDQEEYELLTLEKEKAAFQSTPGGAAVGNLNLNRTRRKDDISAVDRAKAGVGGIYSGIAGLAGMPVDAGENAINLGIAAVGAATSGLPGAPPNLIKGSVGGSEWFRSLMQKAGANTENPNPQDPVSQMLYTGGNVVGNSMIPSRAAPALANGVGPQIVQAVKSIGSTVAPAIAPAIGGAVAEQIDPRLTALGTMVPAAVGQVGREISAGTRNAVANKVNKELSTPYAKEGLQNEAATGIDLTPGQITGNATLNVAENAARQSFYTRNKVLKQDQKVAMQAIDHVNALADRISSNKYSAGTMGETLQSALTGTVRRIDGLRDSNAAKDYGAVRALGNNEPIITYSNTVTELKKIIGDYANVAGPEAEKITSQATRALGRITTQQEATLPPAGSKITPEQLRAAQAAAEAGPQTVPKTVDVTDAMNTRREFSRAAAGSGNIFEDIHPNTQRTLAGRLAGAVNADFIAAENAGKGPVFELLKKANQNYTDYSKSLEYVQTSVLGKLLGKDVADAALSGAVGNTVAGEKVAAKMLAMHPTEAKTISNILSTHAPEIMNDAKAYVIRDALAKGMDIPVSAGANTIPLSYAKFVKNLPKEDYLKAMRFSGSEIVDIRRTVDAMERAGDRTGYNQSQTAVIGGLYNDLKSIASLSIKGAASVTGQVIGLNKIADAMLSKDGRAALRTIVTPGQPENDVQRALAVINSNQRQQGN